MAVSDKQMENFIEAIKTTQDDLTMRDLRKMAIVGKEAMERKMKERMKKELKDNIMGSFKEDTEQIHKEIVEALIDTQIDDYLDEFFKDKDEKLEGIEELVNMFGNKMSRKDIDNIIQELKEKGVIVNSEDDGTSTSIEFNKIKLNEADKETQMKAKILMAAARISQM